MLDGPFESILIPTGSTKYTSRPEALLMFFTYRPGPRVWRLWGLIGLNYFEIHDSQSGPTMIEVFFPEGFFLRLNIIHVALFFWRDANPQQRRNDEWIKVTNFSEHASWKTCFLTCLLLQGTQNSEQDVNHVFLTFILEQQQQQQQQQQQWQHEQPLPAAALAAPGENWAKTDKQKINPPFHWTRLQGRRLKLCTKHIQCIPRVHVEMADLVVLCYVLMLPSLVP